MSFKYLTLNDLEEACDLFASKSLDLVWLPRLFHSPCLLSAAALDGPTSGAEADPPPKDRWFWRVDPTFGAWVAKALAKAAGQAIELPGYEIWNAGIVRNYLDELRPGGWAEAERIANAGPVRLPAQIQTEVADFLAFGRYPAAVRPYVPRVELSAPDVEAARQVAAPLTARPGARGKPPARPRPLAKGDGPSLF